MIATRLPAMHGHDLDECGPLGLTSYGEVYRRPSGEDGDREYLAMLRWGHPDGIAAPPEEDAAFRRLQRDNPELMGLD